MSNIEYKSITIVFDNGAYHHPLTKQKTTSSKKAEAWARQLEHKYGS